MGSLVFFDFHDHHAPVIGFGNHAHFHAFAVFSLGRKPLFDMHDIQPGVVTDVFEVRRQGKAFLATDDNSILCGQVGGNTNLHLMFSAIADIFRRRRSVSDQDINVFEVGKFHQRNHIEFGVVGQ